MLICTLLLALVGVGGTNDGTLAVNDDDALDIFVGLHAVEGFLNLRHLDNITIMLTTRIKYNKKT